MWNLYKPVIAAINGYAVGGGWEIALASDIQYAVPHATFFIPDVHRGFIADAGAIQILPRRLPHSVAMDILLSGRRMGAEEALKWGLVNEIVEPEGLMARARETADHLAEGGPLALQATKEAVRHTMHMSIPDCFRDAAWRRPADLRTHARQRRCKGRPASLCGEAQAPVHRKIGRNP